MNLDRDQIMLTQLAVKVSREMPEIGSFTSEKAHLEAVKHDAMGMMLELRSAVLGARILSDKQNFVIEFPTSWWQHFKRDKMPHWFIKRYPVRTETWTGSVDFTRYDTYPMADVPLPPDEFGYPVIVETFSWNVSDGLRAEPSGKPRYRYATYQALAFLIANDLIEQDALQWHDPANERQRSVVRGTVLATLGQLKKYGVNPDQLIREDVLRSMGG